MKLRQLVLAGLLLLLAAAGGTAWWLVGTEAGSRWALQQALPYLPELKVGNASGTLGDQLRFTDIEYQAGDGTHLQLDELSLRWRPWALLRQELRFSTLAASGLQLTLPPSDNATPPEMPGDLAIPLPIWIDRLSLQQVRVGQGDEHWLLDALQVSARLDAQGLQLHTLQLRGEGVRLSGEAHIDAAAPHALAATLDWQLARHDLPALAGRLRLGGDMQTLTLDQRVQGAFSADISGTLTPDLAEGRHRVELRARWSQLTLPVAGDEWFSEQGTLTLSGTTADYRYQLDARLQHPQSGVLDAQLAGHGDEQQLQIVSGRVQAPDGELSLQGQLAWLPVPRWDLRLQASGVNPSRHWPDWPGELALDGVLQGQWSGEVLDLTLDIDRLAGSLRGYAVAAQGRIALADGRWQVRQLQLNSGDNQLQIDGALLPQLDLALQLDAPDLLQLAPGISGRLQGSGQLRGALDQLRAKLDLHGERLDIAGLRAQQLQVTADIDPADAKRSTWRLSGEGIDYADTHIESLRIDGHGNTAGHQYAGKLQSPGLVAEFSGRGGYRGDTWDGALSALSLHPESLGRWTLAAPVALHASPRQWRAGSLCLERRDARLCASGTRQADGRLEASADWQGVPLALLRPWLTADAELKGQLSGQAKVSGPAAQLSADASMQLSDGQLRYRPDSGPEIIVTHRDGRAQLRYHNAQLSLVAGLRVGEQGDIQLRGSWGPAREAGRALEGEVSLTLPDPGPLAVLIPQVADLSGPLQLHGRWQGTLAQPRVSLDGRWRSGRARLPDLGIELTDIDVQLTGDADRLQLSGQAVSAPGRVRLDGELQLDGARGWPLRLHIEGEDFTVAKRTDVEARVSPALDIVASQGAIRASGRLAVPYARITAKDLGRGAVRSSADEIIVGAGVPQQPAAPQPGLGVSADVRMILGDAVHLDAYGLTTRLTGDIRLHQAAGATAEGAGQLQLVDGRYKAYGQDLTITSGRLLFNGPLQNPQLDVRASRKAGTVTAGLLLTGSLQQPGVTLFSEPAMEQAEILSYLVTGGPISSGSSVSPLMLTQAAIGLGLDKGGEFAGQFASDLGLDELKVESTGTGLEGSVMAIGKRLSPDLYLRYLYGLFDNAASVQIRYTLTERLRLEGQAGQQRAVDLIYEFEKD